jgi:hypothetical protein
MVIGNALPMTKHAFYNFDPQHAYGPNPGDEGPDLWMGTRRFSTV